MNKEFLKSAIMMPLCVAFVLAVILSIYFKLNIDKFIPMDNNTQYAYHDLKDEDVDELFSGSKNDDKKENTLVDNINYKEDKNADPASFKKNQCIGVIRVGKGYGIRYDMDYSRIQVSVSYLPNSVPFGETGFTYIFCGNTVGKEIKKNNNLSIGSVFGDKNYVFKSEESFNSEYEAQTFAPICESAVIIYYRESENAGFTSKYIAMVYEEVK